MATTRCILVRALIFAMVLSLPWTIMSQCEQSIITSFTNISTDSVTVSLIDNNVDHIAWEYEIGEIGFIPDGLPEGSAISQTFNITNLSPGVAYEVYVRTVCSENDFSAWNGPFTFNTFISNDSPCYLNLAIADNSCDPNNRFPIEVTGFGTNLIGDNVFIRNISLIISHSFPEDLSINLISPDGKSVTLSSDNGLGAQNYGNPDNLTCDELTSFSELACERIIDADAPYIGEFQPEESLNIFDGSMADGIWQIEICDKSVGDIGILHYVKINLNSITCPVPTELYISEIHADSVKIEWPAPVNCQAMLVNYGPAGFIQGEESMEFIDCLEESFTIADLTPNTCYDIYLSTICNGTESPFSCKFSFCTSCYNLSYFENFDSYALCEPSCLDECELTGDWINLGINETDWNVNKGATPTEFTGPNSDFKGNGNYLYLENQIDTMQMLCQAFSIATVESPCLQFVSNGDGCDMSFAYHLYGSNISVLKLLISVDAQQSWDTLITLSGEQGIDWLRATIDLGNYDGKAGHLRFEGSTGDDSFGDMAIDDINFYGSYFEPSASVFYTDLDEDGFGDQSSAEIIICTDTIPQFLAQNNFDCDDTNPLINPDATEINCNDVDENCNGLINEMGGLGMIEVASVNVVDELCQGSQNGQISLNLSGGVAPFTYKWSDESTSSVLNNISEGMYSCTISDNTGCQTVEDSIFVNISDSLKYNLTEIRNVTCLDTDNGLIEVEAIGGSGNYNYFWSNDGGMEGNSINTGLSEGFYELTITDDANCQIATESFMIIVDEIFTAFVQDLGHVDCADIPNGFIELNTTGISPIEEIKWSNNVFDQNTIDNLSGGIYSVTVSSSDGCTSVVDSIVIIEPEPIELELDAIEDVLCFGGTDGSIDISITGGTPPYSYYWNNQDTTQDLSNINSGFYRVTITDANSCQEESISIFVDTFDPITIESDIEHVNCVGSFDGSINLETAGGGGEYEYFWNNTAYADSNLITEAPPGIYIVTVVDRFGCKSDVQSFTIDLLNTPLEINEMVIDSNLCFGAVTADIVVEAIGLAPMEFNWSTGVIQTSMDGRDTLFNLENGTYSVTVTDNEGCIASINEILVEEVEKLNYTSSISQISCPGFNDGVIQLMVSGGTEPYRYLWDNGEETSFLFNLSGGLYTCTISDVNDCEVSTQSFIIENPEHLSFESAVHFVSSDHIEVSLDIAGGTPPYSCQWTGDVIQFIDECSIIANDEGPIEVRIFDDLNCILDTSFVIDISTSTYNPNIDSRLLINNTSTHSLNFNPIQYSNLKVIDYTGSIVGSGYSEHLDHLSISDFSPGFYFVKYYQGSKMVIERFLKL